MVILYVETNFMMSIAKGQDPGANTLLSNPPPDVRLVIPTICYVEAMFTWENEKKHSQQFQRELDKQINEASRNLTSSPAKSLLTSLQKSKIEHQKLMNEIQVSLLECIEQLLIRTEMIVLESAIIQDISQTAIIKPETFIIKNDLADNLILKSILAHASSFPQENKVFLSGNNHDFGKPEVREVMRDAGIDKYFRRTQDFLGWLNSQQTL